MPRPLPAVVPVVPLPLICPWAMAQTIVPAKALISLMRANFDKFITLIPD
jgi:hypothetical protein